MQEEKLDDKYIMLGFNKGQIVIYDMKNFDNFLARYEVCRNKILMIREVLQQSIHIIYEETHILYMVKLGIKGTDHI